MKRSADEIKKIVENYSDHILRLAFAYLKNTHDAEDVSQEVFITFVEKAPEFKNTSAERSWLFSVTANKCRDILRKQRRHPAAEIIEDLSYMPENSRYLLYYILKLDDKYRIPIHLHYYEGYSLKEIAELMNSNIATVGTWLSRGRKLLKEYIGDDLND